MLSSFGSCCVWWAHPDLNWESSDYESGALTSYAIGPCLVR
ncbi:hypothetical protein THIOSC15_2930016 [uncultured Thiomicrorhabdus sp.]